MNLGGEGDNVLIGGKNGSGKSTLVYAMSFALVSGRVSIEGLRSKLRRKEQDYWHALVSILFHNPSGTHQKDAPEYVELVAEVKSQAGTERKAVSYYLRGGETADKLELIRKFPSRSEAQEYYKRVFDIDADGYFMFWYQGSIAEFANIPDGERFRRVAEMFQLDEIQRQWQQAREEMKRAEGDFEDARTVALRKNRRLKELEKDKNALEQRDHLRKEALLLLASSWAGLVEIAQAEETLKRRQLAKVEEEYNQLQQTKEQHEHQLKVVQDQLSKLSDRRNVLQEREIQSKASLSVIAKELVEQRQERDQLESKIAEIAAKIKHIYRTKEELLEEQGRLKESISQLLDQGMLLAVNIRRLEDEEKELNRSIGANEQERANLAQELVKQEELDQDLPTEGELAKKIAEVTKGVQNTRETLGQVRGEYGEKSREYQRLLERDTLLLPEQERLIQIYREAGLQAAAFGELFRIRPGIDVPEAERVLGPLKHTVFVERLLAKVPLEQAFYVALVGEGVKRPWFELGSRSGEIFKWVQLEEQAARKLPEAFWKGIESWLNQVEVLQGQHQPEMGRGKLRLWQGTLWDSYGLRGPVADLPSIGTDALEQARERVKAVIEKLQNKIQLKEKSVAEEESLLTQIKEKLRQRREVNQGLPETRTKLAVLDKDLAKAEDRYSAITLERKQLELEKETKQGTREKEQLQLKSVEGELAVYAEFEQEAEAVARLHQLEEMIAANENKQKLEQDQLTDLEAELANLWFQLQEQERTGQSLQTKLNGLSSELEHKGSTLQQLENEADALSLEGEEYQTELTGIQQQYDPVIQQLVKSAQWLPPQLGERELNRVYILRKVKEGKEALNDSQHSVVDEEARQKYEDYALEFAEASRELQESQLRFQNLQTREEERRNEFDKAVYNRWQRTNQKFIGLMRRLNMVGEIKSLAPDLEGRNPQYQWELHIATKMGHKAEKIHPETGRVVGEGISGGERAAVSLVFALALLSDIENKPPFYVLDEFDSALDEERKHEIFDIYREVLGRKLLIVSPKVHGDQYLNRFGKFHCVVANSDVLPNSTVSEVYDVTREKYVEIRGREE